MVLFSLIFSKVNWRRTFDDDNRKELSQQLPEVLLASRADTTIQRYAAGFMQWTKWAAHVGTDILPADQTDVALALVNVMNTSKTASPAHTMDYGLKWAHRMAGLDDVTATPLIQNVLHGIKRLLACPVRKKLPITPDILSSVVKNLLLRPTLYNLRSAAMFIIAFSGFLRSSELLNLTCVDVIVHENFLKIFIAKSKTDKLKQGRWIFLASSDSITCPVRTFCSYRNAANLDLSSDLSVFRNIVSNKGKFSLSGKSLSYSRFREIVKVEFAKFVPNVSSISTHSLRSGGATAACLHGVPDRLFKRHGGWKSESAKDGYIHEPVDVLLSVSKSLGL